MNSGAPDSSDRSYSLYTQPVCAVGSRLFPDGPASTASERDENRPDVLNEPCEVCGGLQGRIIYELPGTRFFILRCECCGLGSLWPRPTPFEIRAFYPEHYYGSSGQKFSLIVEFLVRVVGARHARFFAGLMPDGGRVLDVGCGRGITLHALRTMGYESHGFEVSQAAILGLDSGVPVRVAASLQEAAYPEHFFDVVILWHVLEHVPEPAALMSDVFRILRPGGVVIVAVPNFSSWQARLTGPAWFHLDPPRHLFHFPVQGLKRLLENSGFRCRSEHHFSLRQNPFGWMQSLMNRCSWLPRNGLYAVLHRLGGRHAPFSAAVRILLWSLGLLLAVPALCASVVSAVFRQGATVHIVAVRPDR